MHASKVKELLNKFKEKVLEKVQSLVQEMKGFARNGIGESLAPSETSSVIAYSPLLRAEENLNSRKLYQVPKCFKFSQEDLKQGWHL